MSRNEVCVLAANKYMPIEMLSGYVPVQDCGLNYKAQGDTFHTNIVVTQIGHR